MKLHIDIEVLSDDGKVKEGLSNTIQVATGFIGSDPSVEKQDFLTQAEGLCRIVSEDQIPALYEAVRERMYTPNGGEEPLKQLEDSPAASAVRGKLKALKDKKAQEAEADNGQTTGYTPPDTEAEVRQ